MTSSDMAEEIKKSEGQVPGGDTPTGDTPEDIKKKEKEPPIIHVIPEEFYGAALKRRVRVSDPKKAKLEDKKKSEEGKLEGKPGAEEPSGGGKSRVILLAVLGVMILVAIGLGAYYFLVLSKKKAPPVEKPPIEQPASRCGDGRCDGDETSDTCAADCKKKVVCGDGECDEEEGESYNTCPADCEPPEPVCGNEICEEALGEDYEGCPDDCEPPKPSPSPDTDSDGMTDVEENDIYGTNAYSPDTDSDSFVDLNELLNLFNPAKPQPSTLADNPGISEFNSDSESYSVLHPAVWTANEDLDKRIVTFHAFAGENIEIKVEDNENGKTLMDWYLEKNADIRSSEVQMFRTKGGYDEIVSQDQMTSYMAVNGKIFTVTYSLGTQLKIRYKATFKMMINSLEYTP